MNVLEIGTAEKTQQRALLLPFCWLLAYTNYCSVDRTANACYKDVADIAAQLDQFDKAIEKFELVRAAHCTFVLSMSMIYACISGQSGCHKQSDQSAHSLLG